MDSFRHQKSHSSERFLGLFSQSEALAAAGTNGSVGVELDEDEVLWTGTDLSSPDSSPATANPNHDPFLSRSSSGSFRRLPEKNFGILAALPEDDKKRTLRNPSFLQRKTSISSSCSTSTSPSSSCRMIPAIPKPKQEYSFSVTSGKMHHQSAPLNVPVGPRGLRNGFGGQEMGEEVEADDDDDDEMLPPHEIVARASGKESPMTTFSVLEGAGRTLKGRDLRRVRNAVWRQTGFLD